MLYYAEPQTSETLAKTNFITEVVAGQDSTTLPQWTLNHLCDRLGEEHVEFVTKLDDGWYDTPHSFLHFVEDIN